ncbi:hypothetical protein C8T65DRAFT_695112 [Cerioporus squamosus]|nr:hypothetical protein C8T65DRAFT_695112 [Cerioporus squamosus]
MASSLPDYEDDETCTLRSDDSGDNKIEGSHGGAPASPQYVCPTGSSPSPVSPIYTVSRQASNEFGLDDHSQHDHSVQDQHEHEQQQHEHEYSAAPAVILPAGFRRELYPPDTEEKLERARRVPCNEELGLRDDPTVRQPVVDRDVISQLEHSGVVIDRQEHIVLPLGFRDEVYGGLSVVKPILADVRCVKCGTCISLRLDCEQSNGTSWKCKGCLVNGRKCDWLTDTARLLNISRTSRPSVDARDDGDEDQGSPPPNLWGGPRLTVFGEDIGRVAAAEERQADAREREARAREEQAASQLRIDGYEDADADSERQGRNRDNEEPDREQDSHGAGVSAVRRQRLVKLMVHADSAVRAEDS